MLINVLNGSLKKVAILSNELPNAPSYYNDEFHDYLEQGATTFSFTVAKVINNQLQDYTQFLSDQSYFSFRKNGRDYLMTPSSSQAVRETSTEISFVCVSLDRELINEQANPLTNTASHNIQWYFDRMGLIYRTKITIGINEVSNLTRVINYDAQESKLSRLISVINNFNAEFDFVTTLNNDGSLGTVVLNIYKENDGQNVQGVGTKRDDVRLIFGKNIEDVEVEVSDDGFFNASHMTGANGFSWKNYAFSYKNSDGVEEFYKRKGSEIAFAPLSAKMFPSQLKTDKEDIWTSLDRTTEYKNANDMWGYIVSQFKQYAYKKITYTVTPSSTLVNQLVGDGRPLRKGDTVIIQDDNYMDIDGNVGLILSARVSEIITSDTNPANNKIVFSNYKKLKSEASVDIQAIVSQLVNDATPYFADIATSNGVQFKNGTGSTTLSAHIYKGSATAETIADSYEWSKDGTVVAPTQTITVDASGVSDKAVYSFKATVGGKVVASQSVTITNVNDGERGPQGLKGDPGATGIPGQAGADGKTSYLHIAYATNSTGTTGFDVSNATGKTYIGQYTDFTSADSTDPSKYTWSLIKGDKGDKGDTGKDGIAGKDGTGIKTTVITYAISTSGTTAPTTGWTSSVPSLVKGQYLWTKTVWTYTDNSSETGYSVTYISKDGNNGNDGIAGKDGVGIKKTTITYAVGTSGTTAPASGWNSQVPNVPAGQYLWTKTVWDYTDKTSETGYSVSKFGEKGPKGDQGVQGIQGVDGRQGIPGPKGADGKTQYTHIAYANSANGSKDFSTSDSNRNYIGMYVDFNINDSTTPSDYSWTLVKGADGTQGTPGKPGTDGKTPYFHTAWSYSADGTKGFTTVYPNLNLLEDGKFAKPISSKWNIDGTTISKDDITGYFKVQFNGAGSFNRTYYTAGISNIPIGQKYSFYIKAYSLESSLDIKLGSVNSSQSVTVTNNSNVPKTYKVEGLVRGNSDTFGIFGGLTTTRGTLFISEIKVEPGSVATPYMPSSSEVKTADWPSYIGQYTDFTQTDSTNPSDYVWSLIRGNDGKDGATGKDGVAGKDGVGIKTTVITYALSSSGTDKPVTGWTSQVPTLVKEHYLWTKTVWTYTDTTSETGYTVSYIAKDGNNGHDGIAGKDGTGIKTTVITYASHTNGTTAPTTGYTTTVPSVPAGQFLWTKTVWTYTDNSSETGYSVAMMGLKGDKGDPGNNGTNGIAGKDGKGIKATAITYQASTNGTTAPTGTWSASVPTVAKGSFLWTRTIWTYTDNTTETGYAVAYMGTNGNNGNDGIAGKDGVGIKTTTITYAGSTSGTTAPTSGWTSTVPTVAAGSYLWTKTVWAYTDNTSETGYSVAKMGNNGATGPQGPTGPAGSNGNPGKVVSDTEPSTKFKGLTWKYSGTTDLTASNGTVIKPNTEYYYNGTHWMINYLSANNIEANSITADLIDAKNLTITDGEFISKTTNGPVTTSTEIKDGNIPE